MTSCVSFLHVKTVDINELKIPKQNINKFTKSVTRETLRTHKINK